MEWSLLLMVVGMAIVTYLPRVLPLVFFKSLHLTPRWERFFSYIPYAVLGALIFPGIFSSTGDPRSATIGLCIAILIALLRLNVVFVVLGAILGVYITQLFIG